MFRKLTALLFCLLMLTACSAQRRADIPEPQKLDPDEPLTICFDLDNGVVDPRHNEIGRERPIYSGGKLRQQAVDSFLEAMEAAGGPRNVQAEFIEGSGSDRDGQLTRLRAELMAGDGPDLFVIRQGGFSDLFLFPEKKMEDGLFLCLDGYMEGAQFMEPERMLTAVFDGGLASDGRRFLLPMTYNLSAAAVPTSYLDIAEGQKLTLDDLLDPESGLHSTLRLWRNEEFNDPFFSMYPALGQLADYKKESLSFSKEELGEFFTRLCEYEQKIDAGEIDKPKGALTSYIPDFGKDIAPRPWSKEPLTLVPLYDKEGGVTARIDFYMGVNANASNPAGAFWAADYLLDPDYMADSDIHMYMWCVTMPIYCDLIGPDNSIPYIRGKTPKEDLRDGLTGRHWRAFSELKDRITGAEFPTKLDWEITSGYLSFLQAEDDAAREKAVSEAYTTMSMMLGES